MLKGQGEASNIHCSDPHSSNSAFGPTHPNCVTVQIESESFVVSYSKLQKVLWIPLEVKHSAAIRAGWAAHEVYSSLQPEDFVCGKAMFPIAAAEGSSKINADVFGHWISAVYMTLAQATPLLIEVLLTLHITAHCQQSSYDCLEYVC